jgi:hypothetical protein
MWSGCSAVLWCPLMFKSHPPCPSEMHHTYVRLLPASDLASTTPGHLHGQGMQALPSIEDSLHLPVLM